MISKRKIREALAKDRRYRECKAAGTHPTDSGERSEATLAGAVVTMARCAVCGVRYPAPEEEVR